MLIGKNFVLYGRFWLFSAFFRPFWLIGPHKGSTRVRLADQNFSIFSHNITNIWGFFEKKFQPFRWSVTISFTRLFEQSCKKTKFLVIFFLKMTRECCQKFVYAQPHLFGTLKKFLWKNGGIRKIFMESKSRMIQNMVLFLNFFLITSSEKLP